MSVSELIPSYPDVYNECKKHFNEPVIMGFKVVRLVGYAEDDEDCYYIIKSLAPDGKTFPYPVKYTWHTAVGGIHFLDRLKGQNYVKSNNGEDWDDFYRIDNLLEINGCTKEEKFVEKYTFYDNEK